MWYADNIYCNGNKIVSVTVPEDVTELKYTFYGFTELIKVTLPKTLVSIGWYAFYGCSSLVCVMIGNGVTSIGKYAFSGCSGLTDVHISDIAAWCKINFGNVDANPLYYAKNLYLNGAKVELLEIPDGVQVIQDGQFYNASCIRPSRSPNR